MTAPRTLIVAATVLVAAAGARSRPAAQAPGPAGPLDQKLFAEMRWRGIGDGSAVSGPEAIRLMQRSAPRLGIVAHGELPERHLVSAAMQAGASAYVARTAGPKELRRAIAAAVSQEEFIDPAVPPKGSRGKLTHRQREILQMLANGESTMAAARELDLSEETVKTHTKNALARLGARNRTHAVAIAVRECLID